MRRYLLQRVVRTVLVLLALSLAVFVLLSASGDPASILAPATATQADLDAIRRDFGLDQPIHVQYARFLQRAVTGDFGQSWKHRQPALEMVLARMPATAELAVTAMVIAVVLGCALGVISAVNRGGWLDLATVGLAVTARAMPSFWLGLMLILLFAVQLHVLPTSGRESFRNLVLPATTLALTSLADIVLLVRAGMLATLDEDYIRTARAKGLKDRVVYLRHALRNAAIPVASVIGLTLGTLLGGAVVTETVFSWPGVGSLAVEAVASRDFPLVQAAVFVLAIIIVAINLLTDLTYSLLDPRIRRSGELG
jgi:peptide/nickel transport system permease protein